MGISSRMAWAVSFLAVGIGFFLFGSILPEEWVVRLDRAGIVLGYILACGAGGAGLLTILRPSALRWLVGRIIRRRSFEGTGQDFEVPVDTVRAMIIPVSPRPAAEQPRYILNHLKPERAALLYTEDSKDAARSLVKDGRYRSVNFRPNATEIGTGKWMIHDPWRPIEAKMLTRSFIEQFLDEGIPLENIFVDITAGTVPISVGAFQAAEEKGASTIYIVGTRKGQIRNPDNPSHGQPVFVSRHVP